jgi:hypothetical protein
MSKKNKEPELPIEEMGKTMVIDPIRIGTIRNGEKMEKGSMITQSKLLKLLKKYYEGGK